MQRCVFCFSLLMRSEHSARVGKTVQKKTKLMIIALNTEIGLRCGPLICLPHHWKHCKAYTANIFSGKWDTRKKCKSYNYLPSILQCKNVDITVNYCKSVFTFFH